jgi:hypothetical protein
MPSPWRLVALAAAAAATLAVQTPAVGQSGAPAVRVDAGAGAASAAGGHAWAADHGWLGGWAHRTSHAIAGTAAPRLFQTQRLGVRGYDLALPGAGTYQVKLLLAETQFDGAGKRIFHVDAEGRLRVRNLDIHRARGRHRAWIVTFPVVVADGVLHLRFRPVRSVPAVAGVEAQRLAPAAAATTAPAPATPGPGQAAPPGPRLHVSPAGHDRNPGTAAAPLATIQAALGRAAPGTTIVLAPGVYRERPVTVRSGTATAPITILGPETGKDPAGRRTTVLTATSRVLSINHSHIHLRGFTIDGQPSLAATAYPTSLAQAEAFKQANTARIADGRLVYVGAADTARNLTGVVIDDMLLAGAGGECVRLRNNATGNRVVNSVIAWCGLYAKNAGSTRYAWHNGEGVYIGTSPKSTDQPMHAGDTSSHNLVAGNTIRTYGAECLDVKENAHHNTFAGNDCAANTEPTRFLGAAVELRGHDNSVRGNRIADSRGHGLKLASDSTSYRQGGNLIVGNTFTAIAGADVYNRQRGAQGQVCGNRAVGRTIAVDGGGVGTLTAPC